MPVLNLIVLRADLENSLKFYRKLGMEFQQEQHKAVPLCKHNARNRDRDFPSKPGSTPDRRSSGATMIGFQVENLDKIIETLEIAVQGF